jgi:tRNA-specific 2-thiouridylase
MLKKQGYDVIGLHMRLPKREDLLRKKAAPFKSGSALRKIAKKIGIKMVILDLRGKFKREIVDEFASSYSRGETPNPCVECNRKVKFGLLLEQLKKLKADYLATGHYARIKPRKIGGKIIFELLQAKDPAKDQSYFLYTLTQDKLKKILFPLGGFLKTEIRTLAEKFGYGELNRQKESQDLCFMSGAEPAEFLEKYLPKKAYKPGPILTASGQKVGTHRGLPFYTVGQRKGIGIGGIKGSGPNADPLYVVRLDPGKNALIVGPKELLFTKEFMTKDLSFVDGKLPKSGIKIEARIRYRSPRVGAVIYLKKAAGSKKQITARVVLTPPQRAVTPGQSVVFYSGEKVLGGGIIV